MVEEHNNNEEKIRPFGEEILEKIQELYNSINGFINYINDIEKEYIGNIEKNIQQIENIVNNLGDLENIDISTSFEKFKELYDILKKNNFLELLFKVTSPFEHYKNRLLQEFDKIENSIEEGKIADEGQSIHIQNFLENLTKLRDVVKTYLTNLTYTTNYSEYGLNKLKPYLDIIGESSLNPFPQFYAGEIFEKYPLHVLPEYQSLRILEHFGSLPKSDREFFYKFSGLDNLFGKEFLQLFDNIKGYSQLENLLNNLSSISRKFEKLGEQLDSVIFTIENLNNLRNLLRDENFDRNSPQYTLFKTLYNELTNSLNEQLNSLISYSENNIRTALSDLIKYRDYILPSYQNVGDIFFNPLLDNNQGENILTTPSNTLTGLVDDFFKGLEKLNTYITNTFSQPQERLKLEVDKLLSTELISFYSQYIDNLTSRLGGRIENFDTLKQVINEFENIQHFGKVADFLRYLTGDAGKSIIDSLLKLKNIDKIDTDRAEEIKENVIRDIKNILTELNFDEIYNSFEKIIPKLREKSPELAENISTTLDLLNEIFKKPTSEIKSLNIIPNILGSESEFFGRISQGLNIISNEYLNTDNLIEFHNKFRNILNELPEELKNTISKDIKPLDEVIKYGRQLTGREDIGLFQQLGYLYKQNVEPALTEFATSNIVNLQWSFMLALSSGIMEALYEIPMETTYRTILPIYKTISGLTGLDTFLDSIEKFPYEIPKITEYLQSSLVSIQALLGSRQASVQAVQTALDISRIQPIQFDEAISVLTAMSIYPTTRPYALNREFQQKIFETVQLLSLLAPEQGIEGALFAIREALGGQWRSLQTRFNIDAGVLASYLNKPEEELKNESGVQLISDLHKALIRMFGGTDVLLLKGSQFDVQVKNIVDTLTSSIIVPLLTQNNRVIESISQKLFDTGLAEKVIPYQYTAVNQVALQRLLDYLSRVEHKTTSEKQIEQIELQEQKIKQLLDTGLENITDKQLRTLLGEQLYKEFIEKRKQVISENFGTPYGGLGLITAVFNNILQDVIQALDINRFVTSLIGNFANRIFNITREYEEQLSQLDVNDPQYQQKKSEIAKRFVSSLLDAFKDSIQEFNDKFRGDELLSQVMNTVMTAIENQMNKLISFMFMDTLKVMASLPVSMMGEFINTTKSTILSGSVGNIFDFLYNTISGLFGIGGLYLLKDRFEQRTSRLSGLLSYFGGLAGLYELTQGETLFDKILGGMLFASSAIELLGFASKLKFGNILERGLGIYTDAVLFGGTSIKERYLQQRETIKSEGGILSHIPDIAVIGYFVKDTFSYLLRGLSSIGRQLMSLSAIGRFGVLSGLGFITETLIPSDNGILTFIKDILSTVLLGAGIGSIFGTVGALIGGGIGLIAGIGRGIYDVFFSSSNGGEQQDIEIDDKNYALLLEQQRQQSMKLLRNIVISSFGAEYLKTERYKELEEKFTELQQLPLKYAYESYKSIVDTVGIENRSVQQELLKRLQSFYQSVSAGDVEDINSSISNFINFLKRIGYKIDQSTQKEIEDELTFSTVGLMNKVKTLNKDLNKFLSVDVSRQFDKQVEDLLKIRIPTVPTKYEPSKLTTIVESMNRFIETSIKTLPAMVSQPLTIGQRLVESGIVSFDTLTTVSDSIFSNLLKIAETKPSLLSTDRFLSTLPRILPLMFYSESGMRFYEWLIGGGGDKIYQMFAQRQITQLTQISQTTQNIANANITINSANVTIH